MMDCEICGTELVKRVVGYRTMRFICKACGWVKTPKHLQKPKRVKRKVRTDFKDLTPLQTQMWYMTELAKVEKED